MAAELEQLGLGLLRLEINTIVKPTMTAARMPSAPHAILDIVRDYELWLGGLEDLDWEQPELKGRTEPTPGATTKQRCVLGTRNKAGDRIAGIATLHALHDVAAPIARGDHLTAKDRALADRITDSTAELIGMLRARKMGEAVTWSRDAASITAAPFPKLSPDDVRALRKIWDIGLETVCMQTIVYVDGDVTTRVAEEVACGDHPIVLRLHNEGVVLSVGFWRSLVSIGVDVIKHLAEPLVAGIGK